MRAFLIAILLLALAAPPAFADWQRLGGEGTVVSDEERWIALIGSGSLRAYDTEAGRFGATISHRCPLGAIGRGRALLRCSPPSPTQSHVLRSLHLVDLTTGTIRELRRKGDRRGMSVDVLDEMGRQWAGGLSCGANHRGTCPQVYVNLRTGKRLRIADRRRRDLDSRKLRVIRTPPAAELVHTGPPAFDLLLRRPGRADELLRNCKDSMECWSAYERADLAFWHSDDGTLNAFDARTGARRTLDAPDGSARPVATATRHAIALTTPGGVFVTAR